ncbi:MAG: GntR family transcriptional regulator, partial [Clostridia bacterium]
LKIKPNEFLKEVELSNQYQISRTPLREIIKKLSWQGYVEVMPKYGNRVSLIDSKSVIQMIDMRIVLEKEVQKQLAFSAKDNRDWQFLDDIIAMQKVAVISHNTDEFWKLDNSFHKSLFGLANKEMWWKTIRTNEAHYMRFRKLEMSDNTDYELIYFQHLEMLKAISEKNYEDLDQIINNHVGSCVAKLPLLMDKYGEYFKKR